jgi:hypothetical protein
MSMAAVQQEPRAVPERSSGSHASPDPWLVAPAPTAPFVVPGPAWGLAAASPSGSVLLRSLRDDGPLASDGATPLHTAQALMCSLGGAALFGVALGSFGGEPAQMLAAGLKAPMLLLGTTALCLPAFHVMQLTRAPRPLSLSQVLSIKAHALAATGLWWGALSLPLLFLASTVQHYRLAQGLALMVGAVGGLAGLLRFRERLVAVLGPAARRMLTGWFLLYGVVGAQLSWFLRPFLGAPGQPFELLRGLRSNFFEFATGPLWHAGPVGM